MRHSIRFAIPAVAALIAASGIAHAQMAQAPQQPHQPPQAQRQPLSADAMGRMQDGRIAMIKGALKMSDAQLKLWAPVEAQMRARHEAHAKAQQDRAASQPSGTRPSMTERMERRAAMQAQRAEQDKTYTDVLKPFLAALSDDQKVVAERLLGDKGHGHRGFAGGDHGRGGMRGRTF